MRTLLGAVLFLAASVAAAQTEIILDNISPQFTTTGTWPASTTVTGYVGANYQTHEANGAPSSAIVVDNSDSGFSVTGTWPGSTAVSGYLNSNYQVHEARGAPPSAIVADNSSGSATGTWPASTAVAGYVGSNYQVHAAGSGANVFTWTLTVPASGTYQVYARWTQHPNRATNAKYTVNHSAGATVATVSMELGGGQWNLLGSFGFDAGSASISLSDDANDYVVADAVMLVPAGAAPNTATWTLNVPTSGTWNVYARWTQHPNRATDAKYTVNHASGASEVTVNMEAGGGSWNLLGSYSFNTGATTVSLTDQANGYAIADAVMLAPPGAAPNTATWTPNVAQAGTYEVYARWTQHANRASNATYTVTHAGGATPVAVNQQSNGGAWNLLGSFTLSPGTAHNIALTDQANGYVIADAIRLVQISIPPPQLALHFIHVDHLNTPRLIENASQQAVWRWDQAEPFGDTVPDENPSGLGAFQFPLRLAGTYYDTETGGLYNSFRDVDPTIGRYRQSDPVGLVAGLNTYSHVNLNPLAMADPLGLKVTGRVVEFKIVNTSATYLGAENLKPWKEVEKGYKYLVLYWLFKIDGDAFMHVQCTEDNPCARRTWDLWNQFHFTVPKVKLPHYEYKDPFYGWRDIFLHGLGSVTRASRVIRENWPAIEAAARAAAGTPDEICELYPGVY